MQINAQYDSYNDFMLLKKIELWKKIDHRQNKLTFFPVIQMSPLEIVFEKIIDEIKWVIRQ